MPFRVFRATRWAMIVPVLATVLSVATPAGELSAGNRVSDGTTQTVRTLDDTSGDGTTEDDTTRPTINEFYPEERSLSDCLSSLPKPDCGSDARGGWAQGVVLLAILAGLGVIGWRIRAASRRARSTRTPTATTVPDGDGGAPAP